MKIFNFFNKNKQAEITPLSKDELAQAQKSSTASTTPTNDIENIRLFYAEYDYFEDDEKNKKYDVTLNVSQQYVIPQGLSINDAYKIVSYECMNMAQHQGLAVESELTLTLASEQLPKYGFKPVENSQSGYLHYVTDNIQSPFPAAFQSKAGTQDLFLIGGDYGLFKKSSNANRFAKWFKTGVSKKDIDKICENVKASESQQEL